MSKVNSDNYVVIQGWMISELKLKGNELMVYAIIYGFSQGNEGQRFTGSLQYLADWTNSTKPGVIKNLKSLMEKGLIGKEEKQINSVKFCEYYATEFNRVLNKVEGGIKQSLPGGIQQSLPNNIALDTIADNDIDNIGDTPPTPPPPPTEKKSKKEKPPKHQYGEYEHVLLSDEEFNKLTEKYGEILTVKAIIHLDEYIEMKGYKVKSHYLAIRKWVIDAVKEAEQKKQQSGYAGQSNGSFDSEDFFQAALRKSLGEDTYKKIVGTDENLQKRVRALKDRIGQ